jgi:hypothetical protein
MKRISLPHDNSVVSQPGWFRAFTNFSLELSIVSNDPFVFFMETSRYRRIYPHPEAQERSEPFIFFRKPIITFFTRWHRN